MNPDAAQRDRPRTILLVEDEEITRSFIHRFHERDGYDVIAVDAAEEGIVEVAEQVPDVLIADIHLPGLSGIELASFLLAQDQGLAVILMTGDPDEELARRALACGPVQYLLKPFEWFEMEAAVGFALRQRDAAIAEVPATGGQEEVPLAVRVAEPATPDPDPDPAPVEAEPEWNDPEPPFEAADASGAEPVHVEPDWSDPEPVFEPDVEPEPASDPEQAVAEGDWSHAGPVSADPSANPDGAWVEPIASDLDADGPDVAWVELEPIEDGPRESGTEFAGNGGGVPFPACGGEADPADAEDWVDRVDRESYAGPGHGDRVARLAQLLHTAMDEPGSLNLHDLGLAARVHEAGRLHLPDGEPVELAVRGADLLAEAGFPTAVTEMVRHMHERWDGTSGPDQLSGLRIPLGAQLLAVADALDHYASAWLQAGLEPEESARRAIRLVAVQQNQAFSPTAVGAMLRATDLIRAACMQARPRDGAEPSLLPAMAAAESVPFALFAAE